MTNLTTANQELFRRRPDECFGSLDLLHGHCRQQREQSSDIWQKPGEVRLSHDLTLMLGDHPDRTLNDWSFSQLCRMAGVSKDTINRLSHKEKGHTGWPFSLVPRTRAAQIRTTCRLRR